MVRETKKRTTAKNAKEKQEDSMFCIACQFENEYTFEEH